MEKIRSKRVSPPGGVVTAAIALLLVLCFAECASERRISRGNKAKVFEKVNGWRSQRGGSCLSYGHSCWGAHGKRSGKAPGAAPDWFLDKLFRSTDTGSNDLHRSRARSDDSNTIYRGDASNDSPSSDRLGSESEDLTVDVPMSRNLEAKPMLDDELLSKIRLWQIMKEASEE